MDAMPSLPGKFIWYEHFSPDVEKARAFYEPLLGWQVEPMPMGPRTYHMLLNGSGGIGGFRQSRDGEPSQWVSYLSVSDVDASFKAAVQAGAQAVEEPADFPPVGRGATLRDPTGALFSIWTSFGGDRMDWQRVPFGDWYWNELWTQDANKALQFYKSVFGHGHDEMSMGDQGTYLILKTGDVARAGIFQSPDPKTPPMWMPYVHVRDVDAVVAQATQLGATVFMPATDVPEVGRMAAFFDPLGAAVAVIRGVQG